MKSLRSRDLRVWERIALAKKLVVPQFFEMMRTPSSVLVIWWANANWATGFTLHCAAGIKGRVRGTTDGHKAYLEAVETAFGADCDYKRFTAESDDFSSEG